MLHRRDFILSSAAGTILAFTGCARKPLEAASSGSSAAAVRARALYDRIFEGMLRAAPNLATSLGLDTGERAPLKSRLYDASPAGKLNLYQPLADAVPELRAIDRSGLEGRERSYYDTALWIAERAGEMATFAYGGVGGYDYPLPYVISQLSGSYQYVPDFLENQHGIATREDAEAYLSRLGDFARNVGQEVDRARADAGRGVIPPDFILDKAIAQTRSLRAQRGESASLAASLQRRASAKGLGTEWAARAATIIDGPLGTALDRQLALLTELRARADSNPMVSRLPDGSRFYQFVLRFHTTTNLTPDEAHQIGLDQVRQLSSELEPLLQKQGLTRGTVGARLTALGTDPRYLYANSDAGRAQLLADLNAQIEAVKTRLPEVFSRLPKAPVEVRRVPPEIEVGAPRGYAQSPSLDGSRPGAYYINLMDPTSWPKWALPTLTYHESYPGHHLQGALLLETEGTPLLHKNLSFSAYTEGWALYTEQLADEIGMYRDYEVGRIGMLQAFLYRAARIVIDTGLHAKGWSREQAIRYMTDTVGNARSAAENEIDRYVVWPGQAPSYKIGHTEIAKLREQAQRTLGPRFDIKGFHDAVLSGGGMPLEVLATVVAEWTAERQQG